MAIMEWVENGIFAAAVAVAASYGTIKTSLFYNTKRIESVEQDKKDSDDKYEQRATKLEEAIATLARTQEKCLEGCFSSRQKSLAIPIWRYLRTEDGCDNFLRVPAYEKKHEELNDKVDKISDKIDTMVEKMDERYGKRSDLDLKILETLKQIQSQTASK